MFWSRLIEGHRVCKSQEFVLFWGESQTIWYGNAANFMSVRSDRQMYMT